MFIRSIALAAALALAIPAAAQDRPIKVSPEAWKGFQDYKAWLTSVGDGFFALSTDGNSWGSYGCPGGGCSTGPSYKSEAIRQCEANSGGVPCVTFAHNFRTLVPYTLQ